MKRGRIGTRFSPSCDICTMKLNYPIVKIYLVEKIGYDKYAMKALKRLCSTCADVMGLLK